jgi:hypothetical protein
MLATTEKNAKNLYGYISQILLPAILIKQVRIFLFKILLIINC